jgi:hypothetical protein
MKITVKIVKALAILLCGPLLGILVSVILSGFALPAETAGGRAPGDGFLEMGYVFVGLFVSVPLSILLAGVVVFRSGRN